MLVDQYGKDMASVMPVETPISEEIQKAVTAATGELFDKMERVMAMSAPPQRLNEPKGWYNDPFALLDSLGMGYRANPSHITYETLRQMTERDTLLGCIINTRIAQVSSFCREQENKYSSGNLIRLKGADRHKRRLTNGEKDRKKKIESYIERMGSTRNITRDAFANAMKKLVRDTLSYDQANVENVLTRGGDLYESLVMDATTIRIADQTKSNPRGIPIREADEKTHIMYAQILNGEIVKEFTPRELMFGIRNPRSSLKVGGYGFPEPQILIQTVTAHIWAEEWNRKAFSQGSTIKGVLNLRGNIDRQKYDNFKRQWTTQVGGITNAWRTPIINSDGIEFVPMQMSNTEMGYQMWIEYLVKIACAIYQMDPTEINFDLRGGGGTGAQPTFVSNNDAQQKMSKDRGLRPLLRFFEDLFNRHIVERIDDEFELAFVGLDAKTEAEAVDLRQKQGQTHLTINEVRALEDLDPIPGGDVIMNPTYTGYLLQQAQMQAQGGGGGAGGQQPGQQPGQEQQPPMQQPYGGRFGAAGEKPTDGANAARGNLHAMAKDRQQQDETHEDDHDIRMLKRDDWTSTVHASVRDNDLKKSQHNEVAEFFEIDL